MHRLALGLGGMTVAELEQRMGSGEFTDWLQYWELEPWGAIRDNMHFGLIGSMIANMMRKRGAKKLDIKDFLLKTVDENRSDKTQNALGMLRALSKRGLVKYGRSGAPSS